MVAVPCRRTPLPFPFHRSQWREAAGSVYGVRNPRKYDTEHASASKRNGRVPVDGAGGIERTARGAVLHLQPHRAAGETRGRGRGGLCARPLQRRGRSRITSEASGRSADRGVRRMSAIFRSSATVLKCTSRTGRRSCSTNFADAARLRFDAASAGAGCGTSAGSGRPCATTGGARWRS